MDWSICGLSCYFSLLSCYVGFEFCIGCYAFLLNEMNYSVKKKKKKKLGLNSKYLTCTTLQVKLETLEHSHSVS